MVTTYSSFPCSAGLELSTVLSRTNMIKYKVLYYQRYHCLSKTHRHIEAGRWGVESFLCKMFQALKSSVSSFLLLSLPHRYTNTKQIGDGFSVFHLQIYILKQLDEWFTYVQKIDKYLASMILLGNQFPFPLSSHPKDLSFLFTVKWFKVSLDIFFPPSFNLWSYWAEF